MIAFLHFKDGDGKSLDSFEDEEFTPFQVLNNKRCKPNETIARTAEYVAPNGFVPPERLVLPIENLTVAFPRRIEAVLLVVIPRPAVSILGDEVSAEPT